jgi:hypothetical protein
VSLLDVHAPDLEQAAGNAAWRPAAPAPAKFSAWSAIPRGIGEGLGYQARATLNDFAESFRYMRDATPEQRKQIDRQGVAVERFSNPTSDAIRTAGESLRPDPLTASTAETVLYGFARGAAKVVAGAVVGGVPGVLAAGLEEGITQSDELRRQGVDLQTRSNVGLVQGAGLALAALPAAGSTLKATAALYLAGGPGGFVAQQALTREILRNAGQDKLAEQYDPFDPVGLAVSALIPAPFAFYGLRASKRAAAARAAEDFRAGPVPSEQTPVAGAVREAYAPETVDAAMVLHAQQARAASSIGRADDLQAEAAHETAMARAEDQMARGERVNVADVAPRYITPADREANLAAFMDGSKVVDAEGKPLVVYHGTAADFDAFDIRRAGAAIDSGKLGEGFYFTQDPRWASRYAENAAKAEGVPSVAAVHVSMKTPLVLDGGGDVWSRLRAISSEWGIDADPVRDASNAPNPLWSRRFTQEAMTRGYDGVILPSKFGQTEYVAFSAGQVKSATGNSGRFDPTSASLTDPLQNFADALDQVRRATTQEPARAPTAPQAPSPEAAAPTRGAEAQPAALKPRDLQAEMIGLRKQVAVLNKLLECLNG